MRQTINIWVRSVLRRTFPGVTIPEVLDLEEVAMLEENMREWARKTRREGRREGERKGRREGEVVGMHKLLLRQMTLRFGRLPVQVRRRVEEISSVSELQKLAQRIITAGSLQDLGLL